MYPWETSQLLFSVPEVQVELTFHPSSANEATTPSQMSNLRTFTEAFITEILLPKLPNWKNMSEALGEHHCHNFGKASGMKQAHREDSRVKDGEVDMEMFH